MMKNYLQRLCGGFILCLLFTAPARAEEGVGVTLLNYTFSTVGLGYTITINAQVTNFDSVPFSGPIDFGLKNNAYVLTTNSLFNKPPYSSNQISLYPHETVPAIFSIDIDPMYFTPGPDVVVVWPICTQPIADSVVIPIFIESPNGIKDDGERLFTYIMAGNRIFIKSADAETNFEQVRIYNMVGQVVSEIKSSFITEVPLPALPKGIYVCEFISSDNRRQVIKFFR